MKLCRQELSCVPSSVRRYDLRKHVSIEVILKDRLDMLPEKVEASFQTCRAWKNRKLPPCQPLRIVSARYVVLPPYTGRYAHRLPVHPRRNPSSNTEGQASRSGGTCPLKDANIFDMLVLVDEDIGSMQTTQCERIGDLCQTIPLVED